MSLTRGVRLRDESDALEVREPAPQPAATPVTTHYTGHLVQAHYGYATTGDDWDEPPDGVASADEVLEEYVAPGVVACARCSAAHGGTVHHGAPECPPRQSTGVGPVVYRSPCAYMTDAGPCGSPRDGGLYCAEHRARLAPRPPENRWVPPLRCARWFCWRETLGASVFCARHAPWP